MKNQDVPDSPERLSIEVFLPGPDVLYSLDAAARLAGVPRRSILIYCRAGLVQPVFASPDGMMEFTEEAVHAVRRIEYMRTVQGLDLVWIKTLFDLIKEVERLRAEVRFLRSRR